MGTQPFGGFQHTGHPGCIVVGPVVHGNGIRCAGRAAGPAHSQVVVMGPNDHIFVFQSFMGSFQCGDHIECFHLFRLKVHRDIHLRSCAEGKCLPGVCQFRFQDGKAFLSGRNQEPAGKVTAKVYHRNGQLMLFSLKFHKLITGIKGAARYKDYAGGTQVGSQQGLSPVFTVIHIG